MALAKQKLFRLGASAAVAVCLLAGTVLKPSQASAEDVQVTGPLAGAPSVKHLRIWRKNRLQLEPFFAFMIAPEYSRALLVGGELRFGFLDWLGLGVWGGYAVANVDTNLTDDVQSEGVTTNANRLSLPERENFPDQIGRINWMTGVDVHFTPLRGKLALFQKIFIDTDLSFFAGVAFVGLDERSNTQIFFDEATQSQFCGPIGNPPNPPSDFGCLESQTARSSRVQTAASFGISLNVYFKEFMGIAIRWRGVPFRWNTGGTDSRGGGPGGDFPDGVIDSEDRIRQFNSMFSVGYIFIFPPKIKTTD